jgi:hypothetical protein
MASDAAEPHLILHRSTLFTFAENAGDKCICIFAHRFLDGRAQCAMLHRSTIRSLFPAIYPALAKAALKEYPEPYYDLRSIEFWEFEVPADGSDQIRYAFKRVGMNVVNGAYASATCIEVGDAQFTDWVNSVEPSMYCALDPKSL